VFIPPKGLFPVFCCFLQLCLKCTLFAHILKQTDVISLKNFLVPTSLLYITV
jgi:hypothetical protein